MPTIPHNEANSQTMREVAEEITGTCKSLDDVLQEKFKDEGLTATDFDITLLGELDDMVMECQECNWWCETHDLDDDQICGDCRNDN